MFFPSGTDVYEDYSKEGDVSGNVLLFVVETLKQVVNGAAHKWGKMCVTLTRQLDGYSFSRKLVKVLWKAEYSEKCVLGTRLNSKVCNAPDSEVFLSLGSHDAPGRGL